MTRFQVLSAVKVNGWALKFADAGLRADRAVVRQAVLQEGRALSAAAPALRRDREIVAFALRTHGGAIKIGHDSVHGVSV